MKSKSRRFILTAEQERQIVLRYAAGESVKSIRENCDIPSQGVLYRVLHERGIRTRYSRRSSSEIPTERECGDCHVTLPIDRFRIGKHKAHTGGANRFSVDSLCLDCRAEHNRARDRAWKATRRQEYAEAHGTQCPRCLNTYPLSEKHFYARHRRGGGFDSVCRYCINELVSVARQTGSADEIGAERVVRVRTRMEAFQHYSGPVPECACCGESEFLFLVLDHIAGNGNAHRREIGKFGGYMFCVWLRARGFPAGYRVLCSNCNSARGFYGRCPHEYGGTATVRLEAS